VFWIDAFGHLKKEDCAASYPLQASKRLQFEWLIKKSQKTRVGCVTNLGKDIRYIVDMKSHIKISFTRQFPYLGSPLSSCQSNSGLVEYKPNEA